MSDDQLGDDDRGEKKSNKFAVKGLYRWYEKENGATIHVEERLVLFIANDFDDAIAQAERDAVDYCSEDGSANFAIEAIGWWDAYRIDDREIKSGFELYSRLMNTSLSRDAFIKRYYPKSQILQREEEK